MAICWAKIGPMEIFWLTIGALFKNWDSSHHVDFWELGKSQNTSHMRHTSLRVCFPSANQQLHP